uniref:Uncharacterized protein n=1 Tax=Anopheles farauti TaxID=69004 RepID=A0A182QZI3_9DIPT
MNTSGRFVSFTTPVISMFSISANDSNAQLLIILASNSGWLRLGSVSPSGRCDIFSTVTSCSSTKRFRFLMLFTSSFSACSFCERFNSCCCMRSNFSFALFRNAWNESIDGFGLFDVGVFWGETAAANDDHALFVSWHLLLLNAMLPPFTSGGGGVPPIFFSFGFISRSSIGFGVSINLPPPPPPPPPTTPGSSFLMLIKPPPPLPVGIIPPPPPPPPT